MARPSTKRKWKSEGALPQPTSKSNARKKAASSSPSPSPSQAGAPTSQPSNSPAHASHQAAKRVKKPAPRKSEPTTRTRADEEYDDDAGRMESQSFLALVEFESRKKREAGREGRGFLEGFEKGVRVRQEGMVRGLGEGSLDAKTRDEVFLESFKAAYGVSRGGSSVTFSEPASPGVDFAALYAKSKDVTAGAFALVAKFEEVASRVSEIDALGLVENEWGAEDERLKGVLRDGMEIGIGRYRRMLNDTQGEGVLDGDEKRTEEGFFGAEVVGEVGWGKMAKMQVKAFRKLGRTLDVGGEGA